MGTAATINGQTCDLGVVTKPLHRLVDLHRQFAGRHDNQCFGLAIVLCIEDPINGRQQKSRRLARSRLGNAKKILAFKDGWYGLFLNGGCFFKPHGIQCIKHIGVHGHRIKAHALIFFFHA